MCTYPAESELPGPTDRAGRDWHPAIAGLEEFDGDLFALDVGQLVRTEHNRKGLCLR